MTAEQTTLVRRGLWVTAFAVALTIGCAGVFFCGWAVRPVYRSTNERIANYLKVQTPLGSSQHDVALWLKQVDARVLRTIPSGPDATVEAVVSRYTRFPFVILVIAKYSFDEHDSLVNLQVTKEADVL